MGLDCNASWEAAGILVGNKVIIIAVALSKSADFMIKGFSYFWENEKACICSIFSGNWYGRHCNEIK